MEPKYLNSGSRVILKNKNEKWAEKVRSRKHQPPLDPLSPDAEMLVAAMEDYVTENRLNNVISKIGTVEWKDFGKVIGLFSRDVMEDFEKDHGDLFSTLEKKEQKRITKGLSNLATPLVREHMKQ